MDATPPAPGVVARARRRMSGRPRMVASCTFAVLLAMTVLGTLIATRAGREDARERVTREAVTTVSAIERRMLAYTEVLVGVRALFEVDRRPSRERYRQFVRGLQIEARYPGVETVSFAEVVEPFELARLERRVNQDATRSTSPYPRFSVHPRARRDRMVVLDYLEPVEGNEKAFGYDLASEPARAEAIARTQQTGRPAATAPLQLVQHPYGAPGFLIVLAVREAGGSLSDVTTGRFRGVVAAAFRIDALLAGLVSTLPRGSDLEVYDLGLTGSPLSAGPTRANVMFDRDGRPRAVGDIDSTSGSLRRIDVAGRRWGIYFRANTSAGFAAGTLPWVIALGGTLGSALAAWLVLTLARGRSLAVELAERMTRDLAISHTSLEATNTELRVAEERFRGLLEAAPDAMVIVDDGGTIVLVNQQTELMFGYDRDELVGQPVEILVPERARDRHPGMRQHYAGDPHARPMGTGVDLCAQRKDGTELPVEISLSPLRTDDGVFISSAIRDVSERVRAQDALRLAEAEFRGAFDRAPIGMALIALDGSLIRVNDALCAITGYEKDTLEDFSIALLTHPDDLEYVRTGLRELVTGVVDVFATDNRYLNAAGETLWVSLHATLVRGADGMPSHFLGQVLDITERRRFEDQLYELANHDPLTGLLNRRSFEQALDRQVAEACRYGPGGALLVLDLDHFKAVNDTLGHSAGDELILSVAGLLRRHLRESDILARLGGDEFAVLLPKVNVAEAEQVAASIAEAIRTEAAVTSGAIARQVTVSVGIAPFSDTAMTAEEMLVNADLAMYDAKEAGRNRVAVFAGERHAEQRIKGRMTWIKRMEQALAEDRFVLYAQPIVDVLDGRVAQHELLLRMLGDDGEAISPTAFLSVAERFDMIRDIDRLVVGRAIDLLAEHERAGQPVDLAVNLSGKSLAGPELLEFVEGRLALTGAPGSRLTFEITETAAVANIQLARRFVDGLHDLGCKLALDDFGSGFGSFYYLKHLPFDALKIDGEFVANCLQNRTDQLVIDSVVRIARGLGKQTVAEFTTDAATFEFLREKQVDFAQGYFLGKPQPVAQALALRGPLAA